MKKILAILLFTAFALYNLPILQKIVGKEVVCLADMEEDNESKKCKDNKDCEKDTKDLLVNANKATPIPAFLANHLHGNHSLGNYPGVDVQTPPPNQL